MIAVPLGVVGIVLLLVVPIPAALLDVLIIVNILLSLVILLTSMFVASPILDPRSPGLFLVFFCLLLACARSLSQQRAMA